MKQIVYLIATLFITFGTVAQNINLSGKIINSKGDVVPGTNVQVKGTSDKTVSDNEGNFMIKVKDLNQKLIINSVGYRIKEVIVTNTDFLKIQLEDEINTLSEVKISGFASSTSKARRRSESIQSIPESVTNFTSEQIEKIGVNNTQSFANLIPNVSFNASQNVGVNFITVRGISQIRNGDAPIAFVIDDVTVPDANLINQDLFDLAMIEIVKGPQGALYGKNAIGGAINIYTNSPTNTYQNKIDVGYGNGNTFQTQASFSGPLLKDKIFYRASGSYKNSDGIIYNDFLKKDVDFLKDFNARLQLKFIFSPNVTTTVSGQIIDTKGGATYYAHTKSNPDGSMAANDFNNIIDADQFGRSTLKNTFISQNTQIKGDKVVYKIITSVNNAKRYHEGDLDFGSADVLRQNQNSDSDTYNQEFRLSDNSPNSKFKWMAGAFYQYSKKLLYTKATADFGFFAPPFAATGTQSTLAILSDFTNKTSSLALFGFADYKLSTKLTASFGFRYDNDNIKQDNRLTNTTPSKSEGQFQPKLSLAYQATQQVLAYANFGCGYRSGGFNSSATIKYDSEYKAETSNNYELGIKTSTKDNRFIFNAAAFIVDFKDQQQYTVTTGGTGLVLGNYNLDKTKVTGFEIDIKWRASKFLDILGGYGKTKSEIIEGGKAGTTPTDYSKFNGNITPLVPSNNYYVALQSNIPINNKLDFNGFVNLGGKGKIYWHEDNNDVSDSFTLLDARFGVTINKKISITAWGDNLLNTKYYDEYYAKAISGGGYDIGWKGRPATYGLLLAMKF